MSVKTRDEVGELTRSFNIMQSQLKERLKMKASMSLAMEVQQSLLPKKMPRMPGLDLAAKSIYCDETGGDFYDFLQWGDQKTDRLGIAVGDVSGHGIPSALLMASARAFLRSRARQPGNLAEIVGDVNRLVVNDVGETGQFLTLFYLEMVAGSGMIKWVRAGHDPAFLYDPHLDRLVELKGDGLALGLNMEYGFRENTFDEISNGQIILIGTDGLWEAQNDSGAMFGKKRLVEVLREHARKGAGAIVDSIIDAVKDFQGNAKQEDDVTLVVLRVGKRFAYDRSPAGLTSGPGLIFPD